MLGILILIALIGLGIYLVMLIIACYFEGKDSIEYEKYMKEQEKKNG